MITLISFYSGLATSSVLKASLVAFFSQNDAVGLAGEVSNQYLLFLTSTLVSPKILNSRGWS